MTCEGAVRYWKNALTEFDGLPPVYTKDNKKPYELSQTRSFVVLYNPQDNPTVDCAYFVCPRTTSSTNQTLTSDIENALKGLVCVTYPPCLVDTTRPFT